MSNLRNRLGSGALAAVLGSCVSPSGSPLVEQVPSPGPTAGSPEVFAADADAGELVIAGEGGAPIPAEIRVAVLWVHEDARPQIAVTDMATTATPDGTRRAGALPTPPPAMIVRQDDVGVAVGYLVAYRDRDGDGALTPAATKPWRWPEFRGGINRHVVVYATGPIREGTPLHRFVGAHPGGLRLLQVELTARCEGDACSGHDRMSLGPRPTRMTLVLPADPATYRFPNLD